jgi:hypothetical protein
VSDTPLSDLITALLEDGQASTMRKFHRYLLDASLGVSVDGIPAGAAGAYQVTAHDQVKMPAVSTPDGRRMVKACADPRVFVQRYDYPINAEMLGRTLLEMVLKVPQLDGVLVCSAASFHSIPIGRDDAASVLSLRPISGRAPWWKIW